MSAGTNDSPVEKKTLAPSADAFLEDRVEGIVSTRRPGRDLARHVAADRFVEGTHVDVAAVVGVAGDEFLVGREEGGIAAAGASLVVGFEGERRRGSEQSGGRRRRRRGPGPRSPGETSVARVSTYGPASKIYRQVAAFRLALLTPVAERARGGHCARPSTTSVPGHARRMRSEAICPSCRRSDSRLCLLSCR